MEYREYAVAPPLSLAVLCVWTLEGDSGELGTALQPIVPDGRAELIAHVGDVFERVDPDRAIERQPRLLFAGQLMTSMTLRPTGRIAVLGVRLHPHGAAALIDQPQNEFVGLTIGLDAVSGSLFRSMTEVLDSTTRLADAAVAIQEHLAERVLPSRIDARVRYAVEAIYRNRGQVSIERLATRAGTTRRHLERLFTKGVGVPPKRIARISRMQYALQVLDQAQGRSKGVYTAATCGYADQAHFARECQELCGHSPRTHLSTRADLTRFFLD